MTTTYLTLREAAAALKVKPYRVAYAISTGLVAEPALRVANHRVFQPEDMERLAKHFRNTKSASKPRKDKHG